MNKYEALDKELQRLDCSINAGLGRIDYASRDGRLRTRDIIANEVYNLQKQRHEIQKALIDKIK